MSLSDAREEGKTVMSTAMTETDETTTTDTDLLRHFATTRDEAAFAALVRRHGRLVWGVCRRRLARREDAEDAFQAAFLILALKADSIRAPEALPGWLHRTAHRAALRVASASPVDASHDVPTDGLDAFAEVARREAATAIDEELVRLPDRYRNAVVLFHLEGLERRDVAARLGVSEPTVKGLLTRGRALLRTRLARRGVALPLLLPLAIEPVPAQTVAATCRLSLSLTKAGLTPLDLVSVPAKGIQSMSALISNKMAAAAVVGAACLTLFLVTRGDANTGAEGQKAASTIDTAFDAPANEPEPVAVAYDPPDLLQEQVTSEPAAASDLAAESTPESLPPQPPTIISKLPEEVRIREALTQNTQLEMINTPLSDVFAYLSDLHAINILIDDYALEEEGIDPDQLTISIDLQDVTLGSALSLLLNNRGLTHVIEDEVLKITTTKAADKRISTQVYEIESLIQRGASADEVAKVVEVIADTEAIVPFHGRLLVKASATEQRRIEEVLDLLWRSGSRGPESPAQSATPSTKTETTTPATKIFQLKNADATEMAGLLEQALPSNPLHPKPRIGIDERTNALVVSGPQEQLKIIEAILLRMDETASSSEEPADAPTKATTKDASLTAPTQRDLPRPTIELNEPKIKGRSAPDQEVTVSGQVTKVPNGTRISVEVFALDENGNQLRLWGLPTQINEAGQFSIDFPVGFDWPTDKIRAIAQIENMPHISANHDLEITSGVNSSPLPKEVFVAPPRASDAVADFDAISPITVPTNSQFIVRGTVSALDYMAAPSVPFELYLYPEAGRPNIVPGRKQPIMLLPHSNNQWFETAIRASVPPGEYVLRFGRKGAALTGSTIPVTVTAAPEEKDQAPSPSEATSEASKTSEDITPHITIEEPQGAITLHNNSLLTLKGTAHHLPEGTTLIIGIFKKQSDGSLVRESFTLTNTKSNGEFTAYFSFENEGRGFPPGDYQLIAEVEYMRQVEAIRDLTVKPAIPVTPRPPNRSLPLPSKSDAVADFDSPETITVPTRSRFLVRGTFKPDDPASMQAPAPRFDVTLHRKNDPSSRGRNQQPVILLPRVGHWSFEAEMNANMPPGEYVLRYGWLGGERIGPEVPVTITEQPEAPTGVEEVEKPVISLTSPRPGDQLQTDDVITVAGHVASAPEGTKLVIDYIIVRDGKPSRITSQSTTTDTNGLFESKFNLNSLSNRWPPGPMYVTVRIVGNDSTQVEVPLEVKEAHRSPRS